MNKLGKIVSSLTALMVLGSTFTVNAGAETFYTKGDINNSGTVNITDIIKIASHIKSKKMLSEERNDILVPYTTLWAADVNRDGKLNITDITTIAAQIKNVKSISSSTNAFKNVRKLTTPTETDIIARALRLTEANLKYYSPNEPRKYDFTKGNDKAEKIILKEGIDCSGIINYALGTLGIETEGLRGSSNTNAAQFGYTPAATGDWLNKFNVIKPVKNAYWIVDGTKKPMKVLKNGVSTSKQKYYQYGKNNDIIPVGSIVVAFAEDNKGNRMANADHMWLYLGEYNNANEVRKYIASLTDKAPGDIMTRIGSQKIGYNCNNSDNDGKHWRLESTGTWHGFDNFTGTQINNDLCNNTKTQYLIYVFAPPTFQ